MPLISTSGIDVTAIFSSPRRRLSEPEAKPIQIDCVSGRCLSPGTGSVYSSEPFQGGFGERYERTEPKSVVRSFGIDGICEKGVAGYGLRAVIFRKGS